MAKVFRDYAEVNEKLLDGFKVTKVFTGINAEGSGMMLELEKKAGNVRLGIDVIYNPACGDGETPFMISEEYAKNVCLRRSALENNNGWSHGNA